MTLALGSGWRVGDFEIVDENFFVRTI